MSRLIWNAVGTRFYEAGVDRGVLFLDGQPGVAWNGLTGVSENTSGGTSKPYYQDGVKYLNLGTTEEFEATITAFTYPLAFGACDGTASPRPGFYLTQQRRQSFGLAYRTIVGNDVMGNDHAYKIHLVYNALAEPSDKGTSTVGHDSEIANFSWKITTKPIAIPGYSRTAHMILDSRLINPITMGRLEDMIYGSESSTAYLPTFDQLIAELDDPVGYSLTINGDGTYGVSAPNDILFVDPDSGVFTLDWATAGYNEDGTTLHIGS